MSLEFVVPTEKELREKLNRLRELLHRSSTMSVGRFLPDDPTVFQDPERLIEFMEDKGVNQLEDWEEEKVKLQYEISPFIPVRLPEEVMNKLITMNEEIQTLEDELNLEAEIRFQHIQTIISRILSLETEAQWEEFLQEAEAVRQEDEDNPPSFE